VGLPHNRDMKGRRTVAKKRTLSDAAISALEDKLRRTGGPIDRARVDALCARIAVLPVIDSRTSEEILGYDDFGVPR